MIPTNSKARELVEKAEHLVKAAEIAGETWNDAIKPKRLNKA